MYSCVHVYVCKSLSLYYMYSMTALHKVQTLNFIAQFLFHRLKNYQCCYMCVFVCVCVYIDCLHVFLCVYTCMCLCVCAKVLGCTCSIHNWWCELGTYIYSFIPRGGSRIQWEREGALMCVCEHMPILRQLLALGHLSLINTVIN